MLPRSLISRLSASLLLLPQQFCRTAAANNNCRPFSLSMAATAQAAAPSGPGANNFYTVEPRLSPAVQPKWDLVHSGFRKLPRVFYAKVNFELMERRQTTIKYAGDRYGMRPKRMSMVKRANKLSYPVLMSTPLGVCRLHKRLISNQEHLTPYY